MMIIDDAFLVESTVLLFLLLLFVVVVVVVVSLVGFYLTGPLLISIYRSKEVNNINNCKTKTIS
jgi:hypothetical protein